ncbi:MAG: type II secretion system protein M [Burkholderiales bacterium]|nr:type II secretion system protein M [Burkholderiales bacterium]
MTAAPQASPPYDGPAWLQPLHARWQTLAPRERRMVTLAAWAVGAVLLWLIAVAPALRTLAAAPTERARLDAQLDEMRTLAGEAAALRAAPQIAPAQADAALRAATERLGPTARLEPQADRMVLRFSGVSGPAFAAWLTEVRAGARARVLQAELLQEAAAGATAAPAAAASAPGAAPAVTYTGTVALALGGGR